MQKYLKTIVDFSVSWCKKEPGEYETRETQTSSGIFRYASLAHEVRKFCPCSLLLICVNHEVDQTKQLILTLPIIACFRTNLNVFLNDHQHIIRAIIPHKEI